MNKWDHKFSYANPPQYGFTKQYNRATIAVFWDDVDLSGGVGQIYYQVFQWIGAQNH